MPLRTEKINYTVVKLIPYMCKVSFEASQMHGKSIRTIYWVATVSFSAMMVLSAFLYLTAPGFHQRFTHLGFPSYFRVELALFKFAGVLALLFPVPPRMKEWAYAGFSITLFSASLAHLASGDGLSKAMAPMLTAILLVTSYLTHRRLRDE